VLFGSQPFTSALVMSNPKWFKYELIWDKVLPTGFAIAKYQPMKQHENILIFGNGKTTYNPQKVKRDKPRTYNRTHKFYEGSENLQKHDGKDRVLEYYEPRSIQVFSNANHKTKQHPTEKPIELMEWIVKTYTNEGDMVLDNTMGSGSTGVACVNTNRKFIGIELDERYYDISCKRIKDAISDKKQSLFK
jgi:DNA modification methylase